MKLSNPLSSKSRKRHQKSRAKKMELDATQQMVRIWELSCKPKLLTELEMNETIDPQIKKALVAYVDVVSTRLLTDIIVLSAPESATAKKERQQSSLKNEQPPLVLRSIPR